MDAQLLLIEMIENVIATIPQMTVVLAMVGTSLSKVKKKTEDFPNQVAGVKKEFELVKNDFKESFNQSRKDMENMLKNVAEEMKSGVNDVMTSMKQELADYKSQLTRTNTQTSLLVKENKAFMEVISLMITNDPLKVKDGVAKLVANQLNMTQEELENYTELFIDNLPLLEKMLKEGFETFGQEDIDIILKSLGYERKETETL